MDRCAVCCGEERTKSESEVTIFHSCPQLRPQALGNVHKNEATITSSFFMLFKPHTDDDTALKAEGLLHVMLI